MKLDGVELEFEPAALDAVAEKAIELDIGARGLRSIMEKIMTKVMFQVPSDDTIERVIVTPECVTNGKEPAVVRKDAGEASV